MKKIKHHGGRPVTLFGRICPRCNSINIIRKGWYMSKQGKTELLFCKNCRRSFT